MTGWKDHPSGIRSRPLPDGWQPIDTTHGFEPPFTVDRLDFMEINTVGVFGMIQDAARLASRQLDGWERNGAEITDARNRHL